MSSLPLRRQSLSTSPTGRRVDAYSESRVPLLPSTTSSAAAPMRSSSAVSSSPPPPHILVDLSDGEKVAAKSSKPKRRDTTSAISSFFHRLTHGLSSSDVKEEKEKNRKSEAANEEEDGGSSGDNGTRGGPLVDRPDSLLLPLEEDLWFDSQSDIEHAGWRTALDSGATFDSSAIFSSPLESYHVPLFTRVTSDSAEGNVAEKKSLQDLMERFRNDRAGAMTTEQLARLDAVKRAHERITDRHFELAARGSAVDLLVNPPPEDVERAFDDLFADLDRVHEALRSDGGGSQAPIATVF